MKREEKERRIKQLEAYATTLTGELKLLDERRHILQPLIQDGSIQQALAKRFENTYGAHAYNHLAPLLAQDLVRDIFRLFLDEGEKAGSFSNLYRKASEPKVHVLLRNRFTNIPDKWNEKPLQIPNITQHEELRIRLEYQEADRNEFKNSFDEGWDKIIATKEALDKDRTSTKIKEYRHKYYAHLEMTPLHQDPGPFDVRSLGLTYNEILGFLDLYTEPAFELYRLITGTVDDVASFSEIHRNYGLDMWRVLSGLADNDNNEH